MGWEKIATPIVGYLNHPQPASLEFESVILNVSLANRSLRWRHRASPAGQAARSLGRTSLAQTGHAIAFLPLGTALENGDALEALEDITFGPGGPGGA